MAAYVLRRLLLMIAPTREEEARIERYLVSDHVDGVVLVGPHGRAFARGLAAVDGGVARAVVGLRTGDLPDGVNHEVVHRDDLVVLPS